VNVDRQIDLKIRRVLLAIIDILETKLCIEPSTKDIRARYRREIEHSNIPEINEIDNEQIVR